MKRTFLKVLPFAAALLLATSCSKDENTSVNDEIVNNGGEQIETVVQTFKTLTIKGKVNKSISKVTTNPEGTALAFEANDVFTFGQEGDAVYGTITILDANGNYTATVNYTDDEALFSTTGFTATLGSNSEEMSIAYDDLATAVHNAYYVIPFKVVQNGEGSYLLRSRSLSKAEAESDILVYLQSAFIKALSEESTKLDGANISVAAGKYYVVPVGKTMDETQNTTVAGKIYSLGSVKVTSITVSGGFTSSESSPYVWGSEETDNKTLTATVLPADATNKTLEWTSSDPSIVTVDGNGKITIIAPNTETSTKTITITASAQDGSEVIGTYTLYLANYVQLAGAEWYTYDSQTAVTWEGRNEGAPFGSAVPSNTQLENLINTRNTTTTISGNTIKSNNGSNAYITLPYGDYWSSTPSIANIVVYYLRFNSDNRVVQDKAANLYSFVRFVRAQ